MPLLVGTLASPMVVGAQPHSGHGQGARPCVVWYPLRLKRALPIGPIVQKKLDAARSRWGRLATMALYIQNSLFNIPFLTQNICLAVSLHPFAEYTFSDSYVWIVIWVL